MNFTDCQTLDDVLNRFLLGENTEPLRSTTKAALQRAAEIGTEWQPIETAPKDGSFIYVYDGLYHSVVYWHDEFLMPSGNVIGWSINEHTQLVFTPTHWKPLPTPPTKENE